MPSPRRVSSARVTRLARRAPTLESKFKEAELGPRIVERCEALQQLQRVLASSHLLLLRARVSHATQCKHRVNGAVDIVQAAAACGDEKLPAENIHRKHEFAWALQLWS